MAKKLTYKHFKEKNLMRRDKDSLRAVAKFGYLTREQILSFGMKANRLREMEKLNLFKIDHYRDKQDGQYKEALRLTETGRKYVEEKGLVRREHMQQARKNAIQHSIAQVDLFFKHYNKHDIERVASEPMQREMLMEHINNMTDRERANEILEQYKNRELSITDFAIIKDGKIEATYEIITDNYGEEEIQAKESFSEVMEVRLTSYRI